MYYTALNKLSNMICPIDTKVRTKIIDNFYNSLPEDIQISKEDLLTHINLDDLLNFLEAKKPKRKFNLIPKKSPTQKKEKNREEKK